MEGMECRKWHYGGFPRHTMNIDGSTPLRPLWKTFTGCYEVEDGQLEGRTCQLNFSFPTVLVTRSYPLMTVIPRTMTDS